MQPKIDSSNYLSSLQKTVPTCVDLFCGAGGLSLGFCQAGGKPIAAVDSDFASMQTYRRMFPICPEAHTGSIEHWTPLIKHNSLDVMIGGPPCQGFSLARGFRFVEDPRNHLYKHFVRLVDLFRPKWIVMENVPGITNIGAGVIVEQIHEDFDRIGYWLECRLVNMADFGVPQTRKRAIFVGSRISSTFCWPVATHSAVLTEDQPELFDTKTPYTTVSEALGDLPWPMGKYFAHRANSQMRGPRNRCSQTDPAFTLRVRDDEFPFCNTPAVGAFAPNPVPAVKFVYRPATNHFQRSMREPPPPWIEDFEPAPEEESDKLELEQPRRLAVREQARLQTFPDWFDFTGSDYVKGKQIGNAVPPLFAKRLFESIFAHLKNGKRSQNLDGRG